MNAIGIQFSAALLIDQLILFMTTATTALLTRPERRTYPKRKMSNLIDPTKETEASFLKALEDHRGIVINICRLYCDHESSEEDLFQEIAYQLWKAYPSFQNRSSISTWMYRVALNTALTPIKQRRVKIETAETLPDVGAYEIGTDQVHDMFLKFYRSLDKSDRAIVAMMMENYSRTEIAAVTEMSEQAVSLRVSKLRGWMEGVEW